MKRWLLPLTCLLLLSACADPGNGVGSAAPTETSQHTPSPISTTAPTQLPPPMATQPPAETATSETFILSENQAEIRLPVEPEILANNPESLEIVILTIQNESLNPFSVFVSLEWIINEEAPNSFLLGAFSVFPPDQPGRYALSVKNALANLPANLEDSTLLYLRLQLQPVSSTTNLSGLEVRFSSPVWK